MKYEISNIKAFTCNEVSNNHNILIGSHLHQTVRTVAWILFFFNRSSAPQKIKTLKVGIKFGCSGEPISACLDLT